VAAAEALVVPTVFDADQKSLGEIEDGSLITLTPSCDHRILYGAEAAEFLREVKSLLEQPLRLTLL
jgi:pyruvate dehydrogenase E2 component (dihydrolipoamide acetyltransferase)